MGGSFACWAFSFFATRALKIAIAIRAYTTLALIAIYRSREVACSTTTLAATFRTLLFAAPVAGRAFAVLITV